MTEEAMLIQEQPDAASEKNLTSTERETSLDRLEHVAANAGATPEEINAARRRDPSGLTQEGLSATPEQGAVQEQVEAPTSFSEDFSGSFELDEIAGNTTDFDDLKVDDTTKHETAVPRIDATNGAFASLITGDISEYENAKLEDENGNSVTPKLVTAGVEETVETNQGFASDVLNSPFLSDEQKEGAIRETYNPNAPMNHPANILGVKMLSADSSTDTPRSEKQRYGVAVALHEMQGRRRQLQNIKNAEVARFDTETVAVLEDFVQVITPFAEAFMVDDVYKGLKKEGLLPPLGFLDSLFEDNMGNQKMAIREAIQHAPREKQVEMATLITDFVASHTGLPLDDGNDFEALALLNSFIDADGYGDGWRIFDNIIEILDYTLFITPVVTTTRRAGSFFGNPATMIDSTVRDSVRAAAGPKVNPTAPAHVLGDTNPQAAREAFKTASQSEEASQALYGTSFQDAVQSAIGPEVRTIDETVKYKVGDISVDVAEDALSKVRSGEIERTVAEKTQMREKYFGMYENVVGMNLRTEMTQVGDIAVDYTKTDLPDGVGISAIYGPAEGGFTNAQDAVDMALWSMRDVGVTSDNIQLLARDGDRYVPVTLADAVAAEKGLAHLTDTGGQDLLDGLNINGTQDYLISVKSEFRFKDSDVGVWSDITTHWNGFDRIGAMSGMDIAATPMSVIQSYALDPASMIDTTIFQAASAGVSRAAAIEKEILEVGNLFADGFTKLKKSEQAVLEDIIKNNNKTGIKYTTTMALSDNLTMAQRQVLADWKVTNDTIYALRNTESVRSLRNNGMKEYVDDASKTKMFAKPIPRGSMEGHKVYDPTTGKPKDVTDAELDELYASGGTIARTHNPIEMGGRDYDMIVVPNHKGGAYLRELSDNTQALAYREGHYAVVYKDPHFIDQLFTKADGTGYTRAVATAGSSKEADLLTRQMQVNNPDAVYSKPRLDKKGSVQSQRDAFDISHSTGQSAERARGERLSGANSMGGIDPTQANIAGPVESMLSSARSVANQVAMGKVIQTSKARFLDRFGHLVPVDPKSNKPLWPSSISDISKRDGKSTFTPKEMKEGKTKGRTLKDGTVTGQRVITPEELLRARKIAGLEFSTKELADARTSWNYVNYLENGYANYTDIAWKAIINSMAGLVGRLSSTGEKGLRAVADARGPSSAAKSTAFISYLALAPLRQAIVQAHQAVMLTSNFSPPTITRVSTNLPILVLGQLGQIDNIPPLVLKASGFTQGEAKAMYKAFENSGVVAQIDKQNLVKSGMTHIADSSVGVPGLGAAGKAASDVLKFSQAIGFNAGENVNMMTAWLAHYITAVKEGKNVSDLAVLDKVTAETNNYTLNMNAAGDMRYNVDSLGPIMQFLQVPHKTLLNSTTNKTLTPLEKARFGAFGTVMFGVPTFIAMELAEEMFPDNPEDAGGVDLARHAFIRGAESAMLNYALNDDPDTETDFSATLSATGAYNFYETIIGFWTTEMGEIIANSPSAKLFVGANPRITDAFKTALRAFGIMEDSETTPTTATMAAKEFLKISSGFSALFKSQYAYEKGKSMNRLDMNATEEDAFRALFGFVSVEESNAREVNKMYFETAEKERENVKQFFNEAKKQAARADIDVDEYLWSTSILAEAWVVWGSNPEVQQFVFKELEGLMKRELSNKGTAMFDKILKMSGFMEDAEVMAYARALPESKDYDKEKVVKMFETLMRVRENK